MLDSTLNAYIEVPGKVSRILELVAKNLQVKGEKIK